MTSNPIATALALFFHTYRDAVELDEKTRCGEDDRANHVVGFIERCQVRFENANTKNFKYRIGCRGV